MNGMNRVTLIGNLGKAAPVLRQTKTMKTVANFTMATSERWLGEGGTQQQRTEWHSVVVWGKAGEACAQHLKSGSRVCVEGRLQTRSWEESGAKRRSTEIVAERVIFLDAREQRAADEETEEDEFVDEPPPTPAPSSRG